MQVPRSRNLAAFLASFSSSYGNSCFHSTPPSFAKRKSKWNTDTGRGEEPSKDYTRYATRVRHSNAKKALRDVLSKSTTKFSFQDKNRTWSWDGSGQQQRNNLHGASNQTPHKHNTSNHKPRSSSQQSGHSQQSRNKRKQKKPQFCRDYVEQAETIFTATFGAKCYTWSFRSWNGNQFQNSTWGFEWRDDSNCGTNRRFVEDSDTDVDVDDDDEESSSIGLSSERRILGLPLVGPLKIEDVKSAFRTSALKWHPDKHLGPSQGMAEEKFKLCANAYKSLCSALSSG